MQASHASLMVQPFVPRCLSQATGAEGLEGPTVATAPTGLGGAKAPLPSAEHMAGIAFASERLLAAQGHPRR